MLSPFKTNIVLADHLHTINLLVFLFLFRQSIPIFKYPFIILYILYAIFITFSTKRIHKADLNPFHSHLLLLFVQIVTFLFSLLISNKLYLIVFKEFSVILIIFSFFIFLNFQLKNKFNLKKYYKSFLELLVLFGILIAILGLLELFNIFAINAYGDSTLLVDNNFALLPVIFGFLSSFFLFKKVNHKAIIRFSIGIIQIIMSFHILMSGSKRGIVVFGIILLSLIILNTLLIFIKTQSFSQFCSNIRYYLIFCFFFLTIQYLFFFQTSYGFKLNALENIGVKNIRHFQYKFTFKLYKYTSLLGVKVNYNQLYDRLWNKKYDPINPESGWGEGNYIIAYPLTGNNVNIVPKGSKGYKINESQLSSFSNLNTYAQSNVFNIPVNKHDTFRSSVYCYVSNDYDGGEVRIIIPWNIVDSLKISGITNCSYDMNQKEKWQKLDIRFGNIENEGLVPVYIDITKRESSSSTKMKGYVIFAYPEYHIIHLDSIERIEKNNKGLNDRNTENSNPIKLNQKISIEVSLKPYSVSFSGLTIIQNIRNTLFSSDSDPFRNRIAELIQEDTTYNPYKAKLKDDYAQDQFGEDRLSRWHFALEIWTKEYNWLQKIVGGGFNFLNWYGYVFLKDKTATDYPHNPFLHILLYSGIIGVILYIILLVRVVQLYWKYRKEYPLFFIFFLITYYFTFFSGGNPFDPPVMGFFMMLPFLIHAVHKREEKEKPKELEPAESIN
jgi:hypothetical protein